MYRDRAVSANNIFQELNHVLKVKSFREKFE